MKILLLLFFVFFYCSQSHADEFSEYNKDVFGDAKSKTINIYSAWSENMAYQIKRKAKDGTVVNGEINNKNIESDGFGNVTIKKGANVGPVIIEQDNSNSTIIFQNKTRY